MYRWQILLIQGALVAAAVVAAVIFIPWPFGSDSPARDVLIAPTSSPLVERPDSVGPPASPPPPQRPTPTTTPTPLVGPVCEPVVDGDFLASNQILSYYGNPYTADMGILGELPPAELVARLKQHAQTYDSLNGPLGVQPALHLVYATAQSDPGPDGLYLLYVDEETLREYIDLACENGLLIFLDSQIARSDVKSEMAEILPYLGLSHVHVALDPEFVLRPGDVPGENIGSLYSSEVNAAQQMIENFVRKWNLPDKILIVHQFTEGMVAQSEFLADYPRVRLVIDMDGFGPSDVKRVKYGWYAAPAEYSGIKLFFRHDPDLMSEEDVLGLAPDVIIYQ